MAESLLLAVGGGVLGLLAAVAGLRLLATLPDARLPRIDRSAGRWRPARSSPPPSRSSWRWRSVSSRRSTHRATICAANLSESAGTTASPFARRVLGGLVVVEVALALVLLVGAGLMMRSFSKLLQVHPGFESANLVGAQVLLPATKYRERAERSCASTRTSIERLRHAPGVTRGLGGLDAADVGCGHGDGAAIQRRGAAAAPRRRSARRRPGRRAGLLRNDEDSADRGPVPRRSRRRDRGRGRA